MTDTLRYPIGKFEQPGPYQQAQAEVFMHGIATLPAQVRQAVEGLSEAQLDTPYRPEGWTLRQVVHHLADSHLNAYIRLKLALTETLPAITPYHEDLWAELPDSKLPVEVSLRLLESTHQRWSALLQAMPPADFEKAFYHPENKRNIGLYEQTAMYHWHGLHHLGHITGLKTRMDW